MEFKNKLGKPCTPAQYITDMLIKRRAENENKELPYNYYKISPWSNYYKTTIIQVNSFLKMYSPEVIIAALNDKKGKKIFSLKAPWLEELLEKKEKEFQNKKKIEEIKIEATVQQPQKTYNKNILGKLK